MTFKLGWIALLILVSLTVLLAGCSSTGEVERPVQMVQADRMMERAHRALEHADVGRAIQLFERSEARYLAYDRQHEGKVARVNQAIGWSILADLYQQGDYAEQGYQLLFPLGADAPELYAWVNTHYQDLEPSVLPLAVRLSVYRGDVTVGRELAELMDDTQIATWLTRLWLAQHADVPLDIPNALAQANSLIGSQAEETATRARLWRYQGWYAAMSGDYEAAYDYGREAMQFYRSRYQRLGLAASMHEVASWHELAGDLDQANDYSVRAAQVRGASAALPVTMGEPKSAR